MRTSNGPRGSWVFLVVPDHAGQLAEPRPVSKCPAGEVDQHQAAALLDQPLEVGSGLASCGSGCSLRKWSRTTSWSNTASVARTSGSSTTRTTQRPSCSSKALEAGAVSFQLWAGWSTPVTRRTRHRGWRLVFIGILYRTAQEAGNQGRHDQGGHIGSPFESSGSGKSAALSRKAARRLLRQAAREGTQRSGGCSGRCPSTRSRAPRSSRSS